MVGATLGKGQAVGALHSRTIENRIAPANTAKIKSRFMLIGCRRPGIRYFA